MGDNRGVFCSPLDLISGQATSAAPEGRQRGSGIPCRRDRRGDGAPGFGRAASAAALPFELREEIAGRFRTEHALRRAEHMLQTGSADAPGWPGWPGARVLVVLDDLYRLNAIAFWYSPTDAAMLDVDWSAIDALMRILNPPLSP